MQLCDTRTRGHTHTRTQTSTPPPLLSFFTPQLSSLPVSLLRLLCFTTSGSARFFIEGLHLAVLGALLLVQSLSLISDLPRLSVCFYVQGFFFYLHPPLLPSAVGRLLFLRSRSQKSYSERRPPKAVPSLRQTPSVNIPSPQKICCTFFCNLEQRNEGVKFTDFPPFVAPKNSNKD